MFKRRNIGGDNLTAKERVLIIRLSEKINKNPEYAEQLGVSVINVKTDNTSKCIKQPFEVKKLRGKTYGNKSICNC